MDNYDDILDSIKKHLQSFNMEIDAFERYRFHGDSIYPAVENEIKVKNSLITDVISIQFNMPLDASSISNVDYLKQIASLSIQEFKSLIVKKITSYIKNNGENNFIDFSTSDIQEYKRIGPIIDKLNLMKSKNIVSNSRIISELQDSPLFQNDYIKKTRISNSFEKMGHLNQTIIYLDPYINWNKNYILGFDKCLVDWDKINVFTTLGPQISPVINIQFELKFYVKNPKILYIYTPEYMDEYSLYKIKRRDDRIDEVLG